MNSNRNSGLDDLLTRNKSRDSEWDMLSEVTSTTKPKTSSSAYGSATSRSSSSTYVASASTSDNADAQKKFGNAKAISSEQFFLDAGAADVIITF